MNTWKTYTKLRIASTNNRSIKSKGTVHYQEIKLKTDNKTKTQILPHRDGNQRVRPYAQSTFVVGA
jgi:hypothetical protein